MSIKPFIACYTEEEKSEPKKQQKVSQMQSTKPQMSNQRQEKQMYGNERFDPASEVSRNNNILMAVLSLMKELDINSLEIVKREADILANQFY